MGNSTTLFASEDKTFASPALSHVVALHVERGCSAFDIDEIDRVVHWLDVAGRVPDRRIILDFTNASFVGARLIGVLAGLTRRFDEQRCKLVLCGLNDRCAQVAIQTTKLNERNFVKTWNEKMTRAAKE